MKDFTKYLFLIGTIALVASTAACGDTDADAAPTDDFDVRIELPATADVTRGGELTLKVRDGKAPLTPDSFRPEGGGDFAPLPHSEGIL